MRPKTRAPVPRLAVTVVALVVGLATLGCGRGGPRDGGPAEARKRVRIGVSLLTRTHPFYQELEAGLAAELRERLVAEDTDRVDDARSSGDEATAIPRAPPLPARDACQVACPITDLR